MRYEQKERYSNTGARRGRRITNLHCVALCPSTRIHHRFGSSASTHRPHSEEIHVVVSRQTLPALTHSRSPSPFLRPGELREPSHAS